jgi:hypothetical protein
MIIFFTTWFKIWQVTHENQQKPQSHKHRLISYKKIPRSDSLYEGLRNFTTENMGSYLLPENDNCIDCEAAQQCENLAIFTICSSSLFSVGNCLIDFLF